MKIVVLANRDLAACSALNRLWPTLLEQHELQLVLSSRVGRADDSKPLALRQLASVEQQFFNEFIFPLAQSLPTVQVGRGVQKGPWLGFEELASQSGNPLRIMNKINEGDDYQHFLAMAPDLVLSIRYGVILKQPVLDIPRCGVINLHSGLLPDYRGVMASFWALLNGESELGTTLHFIDDDTIDTGRILARTRLPVRPEKSYLWHVMALYEEGCRSILETVSDIAAGNEPETTPQAGAGAYYTFPDLQQVTEFHNRGLRLFDVDDLLQLSQRFIRVSPIPY